MLVKGTPGVYINQLPLDCHRASFTYCQHMIAYIYLRHLLAQQKNNYIWKESNFTKSVVKLHV